MRQTESSRFSSGGSRARALIFPVDGLNSPLYRKWASNSSEDGSHEMGLNDSGNVLPNSSGNTQSQYLRTAKARWTVQAGVVEGSVSGDAHGAEVLRILLPQELDISVYVDRNLR